MSEREREEKERRKRKRGSEIKNKRKKKKIKIKKDRLRQKKRKHKFREIRSSIQNGFVVCGFFVGFGRYCFLEKRERGGDFLGRGRIFERKKKERKNKK